MTTLMFSELVSKSSTSDKTFFQIVVQTTNT